MPRIKVNVSSSALDVAAHWERLVARAPANAFMHPAALNAVHATNFAKLRTLLAWDGDELVGVWALQETRVAALWPRFLAAPPYEYAFVSDPVVDPACRDEVMRALFDAIADDRALPKLIRLKYLDGEAAAAIATALRARAGQSLQLSERTRPFATRESGQKRSGSTRKKLRQDLKRLSALGAVEVVNDRAADTVREAFEVFLAMEAKSWKGGRGTALLSKPRDAAFARRLIAGLGACGSASVALLRVAGQPIAAQVLLYCGRMAYTWKTAFDAEYAKYSPGALLVDNVTEQLFAGSEIDAIESCSPHGSFMAQLWSGERTTVDLLIDTGTAKSLGFRMATLWERGYEEVRSARNRIRAAPWFGRMKSRAVPAPR